MSKAVEKMLHAYNWPGNIRELKNVIERLVIMAENDTIDTKQLPANFLAQQFDVNDAFAQQKSLQDFRDEVERQYIKFCLEQLNGNISQTALRLQVDRSYLHRKIKKLDIN